MNISSELNQLRESDGVHDRIGPQLDQPVDTTKEGSRKQKKKKELRTC